MADELKKNEEKELELDDLIIGGDDEEDSKDGQNKKLILIGAIAVVLFAVIVLVIYFLQSDDKKEASALDTQKQVERVENTAPVVDNKDFSQLPIEEEKNQISSDEQFQKIIEQIKAQQGNTNPLPNPPVKEAEKKIEKPQEKIADTKVIEKPKKIESKPQEKAKQEVKKPINAEKIEAGFYIQVGSFSKAPNQKLLESIKAEQYTYTLQKLNGSAVRLLIGPYSSKESARKELANIKEKFNKDAFIKESK